MPSDLYFADVKDCGEGETVKDLVKKAMDIWDLEFEIKFSSKTKKYTFVFTSYLEKRADYHIDDEINANNMKYEEDSGELYTYAVGYGDYTDDEGLEGAGLIEYFEHPEMKDIGKYEAPPIKDGTIKDPDIMKAKLQTLIYESIKISLTLDFITLRKYYPNAIPKIGDVVKVKHSILGINQFMRIVEVTTVRDADNKIVKQDVTLGDFNRHARYLKRLSEAAQVIGGLGGGSFASNYRKTESKANSAATRGGKGSKPVEIKGEDGKTYDLSEITVDKDGNLKVKEVN
ncbi:phage tail protein [Staphylococcus lugdunensis]|nr:phage tail protein [Staphylococcus lugdunensis]MDK7950925.1 phage tail protein [Staphylococcus lugdunensis]